MRQILLDTLGLIGFGALVCGIYLTYDLGRALIAAGVLIMLVITLLSRTNHGRREADE